jgi:hypothetical protein
MANKEFTKFELARMKRTAQNVDGFLKQKNKLEAKKAEIDAQLKEVMEQIELTDAPTVAMTGYHTEDIIKKVVTPTDQVTKDGTVIKKTTFEFIYPDTIVPPAKEITEDEEEATDSTYYSEAEEGTTKVEIKGETVE